MQQQSKIMNFVNASMAAGNKNFQKKQKLLTLLLDKEKIERPYKGRWITKRAHANFLEQTDCKTQMQSF